MNNPGEVVYVCEMNPGLSDEEVLNRASATRSILLTCDKGFGELVFRQGRANFGVALLRLAGTPAHEKAEIVSRLAKAHGGEMRGSFSVITTRAIRIRKNLSVDDGPQSID